MRTSRAKISRTAKTFGWSESSGTDASRFECGERSVMVWFDSADRVRSAYLHSDLPTARIEGGVDAVRALLHTYGQKGSPHE